MSWKRKTIPNESCRVTIVRASAPLDPHANRHRRLDHSDHCAARGESRSCTLGCVLACGVAGGPWPQSLLRAFLWSNVYLLCAGLVDYLFDANYGYLREKPQRASLLDYLGPWPIYIGGLEIVAAFAFFVLYSPFLIADSLHQRA